LNRDTYTIRLENESANDRNDRAIRQVCHFYNKHVTDIKSVLLSDDNENRRLATEQGLLAINCRKYVESLNKPELIDRIAAKENKVEIDEKQLTDATRKNKHIIFPEHMRMSDMQSGLKSGRLHQGTFQSSRENYLEANVFLYENEKYPQVFVQGYKNLNRAVHDDIVAVELLPESEWATPTSLILEEVDEDVGDFVNEKVRRSTC
jgi:exosome complex exonuclease DIS3/RRP44